MNSTPDTSLETCAEAMVRMLTAHGVDVIFGLPGEENLPLVSALRTSPIELVVCRHEQHAAFMAVAHARVSGRVGVCMATLGPGALNLFTGLSQALLIRVPVVALTGQKSAIDNDEGPFQVVDVVGAARPLCLDARRVVDPNVGAAMLDDAIGLATSEQGPVLIELPEDVAATPVARVPMSASDRHEPVASDEVLHDLAEQIDAASKPLLIAGRGSVTPAASAAIRAFVNATGVPVLATQMGKGCIDETHPNSLGSMGMHRRDYVSIAIDDADLLVTIGYQPVEHPPQAWNPGDVPIIHISPHRAQRVAGYQPGIEVLGAIPSTFDRLVQLVAAHDGPRWSAPYRRAIDAAFSDEVEKGVDSSEDHVPVALVPDVVRSAATTQHVVALDNGLYKLWFARRFRSPMPHSLVLDNALGTMGAGLASGMAAARLGHPVIVVTGDGGFMMNVGDLETAQRLGLALTVLVLRDQSYGFIEWHQTEQDRVPHGVALTNPDFVQLATAFGADAIEVTTVGELRDALAAPATGLRVIDCRVVYRDTDLLERDDLDARARNRFSPRP